MPSGEALYASSQPIIILPVRSNETASFCDLISKKYKWPEPLFPVAVVNPPALSQFYRLQSPCPPVRDPASSLGPFYLARRREPLVRTTKNRRTIIGHVISTNTRYLVIAESPSEERRRKGRWPGFCFNAPAVSDRQYCELKRSYNKATRLSLSSRR